MYFSVAESMFPDNKDSQKSKSSTAKTVLFLSLAGLISAVFLRYSSIDNLKLLISESKLL
ncbi:hypothetical protein AWENTII_009502 [Aspergillus wentii]|nr:hypothetical protein MW887_001211 [Aspergillus wentii]